MEGLSEREFVERMNVLLSSGKMMDLLRVEAQARLYDWIGDKASNGKPFSIVFRLSANRIIDVALYCLCRVDMQGDEPLILVDKSFPSVFGVDKGVGKAFEVELRDLEIGVTHGRT